MSEPVVFDRVAEVYDATRGFPAEVERAVVAAFARAFGPLEGLRVVEPGVGTGRVALPLLRAGADVRGVDLAPGMLARLGAKAGPGWEERFTLGDATALPYPDGSFDAAVVAHLLHLVPMEQALAEVRRVLRPGGVTAYWFEEEQGQGPHALNELAARAVGLPGRGRYTDFRGMVVEHLLASGATVSKLDAARWQGRERVSELLGRIRDRTYSWQWPLDEDQHRRAVAAAEAWALEQPGSHAAWEVRLALYVARW